MRRLKRRLISAGIFLSAHSWAAALELPERFKKYPYTVQSLSVGHPNQGRQLRAKRLREQPYLRFKRGSHKRAYGHPALVLMLQRTARGLRRSVSGSILLVGDLSRKTGGPLSGHFSHQSGRDADVGFYMLNRAGKSVTPDRFVKFGADGIAKDGSRLVFDDYRNWLLVQSWVQDKRAGLSHIFVSRELRARLLRYGASKKAFKRYVKRAAALLKQPEHASPHDDHFHVRIACPKGQVGLCKPESLRNR